MMILARRCARALVLATLCRSGVAFAADGEHDHVHAHDVGRAGASEVEAARVDAAMEAMVGQLLKRHAKSEPSRKELVDMGMRGVDLQAAARRLEGKLPADVASLVRKSVGGKSKQPFAEESLAKALKYLNMMVEKAWEDLDGKLIECKEFEDRNRGSFEQVMTDIARLAEQIADLERMRAMSVESIATKEQELLDTAATLKTATTNYMKIFYTNKMEMTIRTNDLAVFQFMLKLVKCKPGALMQLDQGPQLKVCESEEGLVLNFGDKKLQADVERKVTPATRLAIREVLGHVTALQAKQSAGFLQGKAHKGDDDDDDEDDDFIVDQSGRQQSKTHAVVSSLIVQAKVSRQYDPKASTTTTAGLPTPPVPKMKVDKHVSMEWGALKCTNDPPDCGLLHDGMSLMWGKFKDLVDELQAEMDKNKWEFETLKADLNQQLEILRNSKARFTMELNEAISNLNGDRMEMGEKEEERLTLEEEYHVFMHTCKARISWIVFQDICQYLKVRATIMAFSKVSPPEKITDCSVTAWIPGECSVPCDDNCPDKANPFGCGGWQTLTRAIVTQPNEFGIKCPNLALRRKCSQVKCPVDCVMSRWSSLSKCTKSCEGGVQGRTREVLTKPRNGGMSCNTAQESRPCNTGSCDRNCRLKRWSSWSPCSVACGGGFQERLRRVIVPVRGEGKCPKPKSKIRYGLKKCNTHECVGDEICIAKQDLVISIDGSGSLRESGFEILKAFAANLVDKYMGEYYGHEDMKIGVVQFGNGEILDDGTVAGAVEVQGLTGDMGKVKKAIEGLPYLKGFTNMAQAFTLTEKLLLLKGRKSAQSAVMTLTDGKPSFLFQTYEKVLQLKDKHTKLFFVPITEFAGEELQLMKKWASQPWETHLVHIPGLEVLQADNAVFAQRVLVKFCPAAMSPSSMEEEEMTGGFMLVRENGACGERGQLLSTSVMGVEECAALAEGASVSAFALGVRYARGRCFAQTLEVTMDMVNSFNKNRADPPCPGGKWKDDSLYDFYIIVPEPL